MWQRDAERLWENRYATCLFMRWSDLSRGPPSLLYDSLHHRIEAANPHSNCCAAADMCFLSSGFTSSLDIVTINTLIVDLGLVGIASGCASGVAKHMRRMCPWHSMMWVCPDIWKVWLCVWGTGWFNADQLLNGIWSYFYFLDSSTVWPVYFVLGQISVALCSE